MNRRKEMHEYEEYLYQRELSKRTIQIYLMQVERFWDFLQDRKITKKETMQYKMYMHNKKWKISTINLYIVAVNNYLRYAGYDNCVIKTERVQRRQCPDNVISYTDYQKMLATTQQRGNEKYYCLIRTLALTGIRIGELSGCSVEALREGKFTVCNKGKIREIYLPPKLVEELIHYCEHKKIDAGPIFLGNRGTAINRVSVYKMLVCLAKEAGVPKERVHPHSFRHLFALTYMKQYSNLFELADILGHSSLETTRIYTASSAEEKRNRMNDLEL